MLATSLAKKLLMENQSKPKKPMSGFTKFVLVVLGFILLSFVLQMGGIKVVHTSEEDTMIERPHSR